MSMLRTGVKLTPDETSEVIGMAKEAGSTPYMLVTTAEKNGEVPPLADRLWERTYKRINELAVKYGLPDLDFYYTVLRDGELAIIDPAHQESYRKATS